MNDYLKLVFITFAMITIGLGSCTKNNMIPDDMMDPMPPDSSGTIDLEVSIENLLTTQIDEIIIPTVMNYQEKTEILLAAAELFEVDMNTTNLDFLKASYFDAYTAYQHIAVHDYFATQNTDLVTTSNLYPVDVDLLESFIENESYDFNSAAQLRANGYPAMDYLLYGSDDMLDYFSNNSKRANFLVALTQALNEKANFLLEEWTGSLRENFINNGGVELGSSISVQLNQTIIYFEEHVRENKIGLPIGRSGPNDTPFDADPTIIESYYESLASGDDGFSLSLIRSAVQEMENIYLGMTSTNENNIGYDDLLIQRDHESIDADIKTQFQEIYNMIDNRSSIVGDESLYDSVQELISLYKSDLFPVLNIQDADGSNDGD